MVLEILQYWFVQKAFISGVTIAIICSFVGCFLVLRRYALFGDGIAHVAFGGIAAGMFFGIYPIWTAFVVSIIGSVGLQKMRSSTKMSGEIAVAIILVSGLSVGVILSSASGGFSTDLFSFLFGSIILVSTDEMIMIVSIGVAISLILMKFYKQLMFVTFNEEMAKVAGIRVTALNYLFVILVAITVVAAMRLTGILLITAMIVLPTVTAIRLKRGFKATIVISMAISSAAVISGIFISYVLDWAPSGTIVVLLVGSLLVSGPARKAPKMVRAAFNRSR